MDSQYLGSLSSRHGWNGLITAQFEVSETVCSDLDDVTPVGVDIGEAALATVCHRNDCDSPVAPRLRNDEAKIVRELCKRYLTAMRRLHRGEADVLGDYDDGI